MAKISPPASHRNPFLKFLQRTVPLLTLAGLISCGGSSNTPAGRGGGGGGGGGNGADCKQPVAFSTNPLSQLGVGTTIPDTFLDLHLGSSGIKWPTVPFGGLRLWDTATGWAQINTASGVYDWSVLDGFVSQAQAHNVDLLYNLARVPAWISSNASDSTCAYSDSSEGGPGQCDPPTDLNADGTGTDAAWIAWVSAVASRNASQYGHQIKFYEIWNEWNASLFWLGTPAQLVRFEQDARCVIEGPPAGLNCNPNSAFPSGTALDPSAKIVSPSPVGNASTLNAVQTNLQTYFGTTVNGYAGGQFADIIGFHGYVSSGMSGFCPIPENVVAVIDDMNSAITAAPGESGKPWFDTEDGWSKASDEGFLDQDRQAAFLARYDMIQASMGVARGYWYRWDSTQNYEGALWTSSTGTVEAVDAWSEVSKWMVGATLSSACKVSGTVWQCGFTRSGGYQAIAVWDASQDCVNGSCTTSTFTVPSGYIESRDLTDKVTTISGGTTPIGAKPVLLENGPIP